MYRSFRVFALVTFFLLLCVGSYAQNMDLIVTTKGDSIACHIDSIDDAHIYFNMKSRGARIPTHMEMKDVSDYIRNVIDRKAYLFEPGSSIISSPIPDSSSLYQVQRNSVYLGLGTLMYSRMFPVNKIGITLGGGIYNFDGWGMLAESTVLVGGIKHFFEPGIMALYSLEPVYSDAADGEYQEELSRGGATFRIGYRYQGPKGLLIRGAVNIVYAYEDAYVWPALSLGYSF